MRTEHFPTPVSDTEAAGLPDTADDDSTAYDDVDSPRIADGPDPGLLPAERGDHPLAVDRFGTTPEEALEGESLELKVRREVPDVRPGPLRDADVLDDTPVDPNLDSPVSMYDTGIGGNGQVGRLVEPDQGFGEDTEKDAIAYDAGSAGGGVTAEEAAIHEIPER